MKIYLQPDWLQSHDARQEQQLKDLLQQYNAKPASKAAADGVLLYEGNAPQPLGEARKHDQQGHMAESSASKRNTTSFVTRCVQQVSRLFSQKRPPDAIGHTDVGIAPDDARVHVQQMASDDKVQERYTICGFACSCYEDFCKEQRAKLSSYRPSYAVCRSNGYVTFSGILFEREGGDPIKHKGTSAKCCVSLHCTLHCAPQDQRQGQEEGPFLEVTELRAHSDDIWFLHRVSLQATLLRGCPGGAACSSGCQVCVVPCQTMVTGGTIRQVAVHEVPMNEVSATVGFDKYVSAGMGWKRPAQQRCVVDGVPTWEMACEEYLLWLEGGTPYAVHLCRPLNSEQVIKDKRFMRGISFATKSDNVSVQMKRSPGSNVCLTEAGAVLLMAEAVATPHFRMWHVSSSRRSKDVSVVVWTVLKVAVDGAE